MERNTPVRKPHTSTADLLTWSENPPENSPAPTSAARSSARSHQPSDGIRKVVFGGQVTDEEVESLNKSFLDETPSVIGSSIPDMSTIRQMAITKPSWKPCSDYKMKEITGSGIFASRGESDVLESDITDANSANKTGLRMYQQAVAGMSQISFGDEGSVTPKRPTTVPEVAKQRELSGNLESEAEASLKKQISDAKCKELSGNNIFAPPPEIQPRPLTARAPALRESITLGETASRNPTGGPSDEIASEDGLVKTAKKIPEKKFEELSGNNIFKGDEPPSSAEKPLSSAKLREMSGSNIFADGKVESRDYFGGVRKPPGGESSIALV